MSRGRRRVGRVKDKAGGEPGFTMHAIIDQLRGGTSDVDLHQVVLDLAATMDRDRARLVDENEKLSRRVERLERVIMALGAAAAIIDPPTDA